MTDQVPSVALRSSACWREMPGSAGGPVRSMSGWRGDLLLRRPMRTSVPESVNRRSTAYTGKVIVAASAASAARTWS